MRLVILALILGSLSIANTTLAASATNSFGSVEQLEVELAQKKVEYTTFVESLARLKDKLATTGKTLDGARAQSKVLRVTRKQALIEMNEQYELMVENPEQDITPAQNAYRDIVIEQKSNKEHIQILVDKYQQDKYHVEQANINRFTLANSKESLVESIKVRRAQRLRNEFEKEEKVEVSRSVVCSIQETLQKCIARGNLLAKQKASQNFITALFSNATEASLIAKNKQNSTARVKVLDHKVLSGEFSGQGTYNTKLSVSLAGSLPTDQACVLLAIPKRYCVETAVISGLSAKPSFPESKYDHENVLYEVTIRSDQYDDEVFIDGVSYGSTKLTTMLAAGAHELVISKQGFDNHQQRLFLNRNMIVKVELLKAQYNLASGEKVQDIIAKDSYGPELVGISAGKFQMGELKGAGFGNEKPAKGAQILNSFAIGQSQITVADFKKFVDSTQYVTEAEINEGCAVYVDGQPQYNATYNWRNPGFKQSDRHPVVCVSEKDSGAYLSWLSRITDRKYRLPKETEWEYVARAGSSEDYWWGSDVGNGKANCAYCGSIWSNVSTAPVKSFRANRFGLYDTVGNVWELTSDKELVARGGSWNFAPKLSKASVRLELSRGFRSNYLGFRALREN